MTWEKSLIHDECPISEERETGKSSSHIFRSILSWPKVSLSPNIDNDSETSVADDAGTTMTKNDIKTSARLSIMLKMKKIMKPPARLLPGSWPQQI
jgi:hypothetical protein